MGRAEGLAGLPNNKMVQIMFLCFGYIPPPRAGMYPKNHGSPAVEPFSLNSLQ